MKPLDAYIIICNKTQETPEIELCIDLGDSYGFALSIGKSKFNFVGSAMTCVNKNTKKIFDIDMKDEYEKIRKAKIINLDGKIEHGDEIGLQSSNGAVIMKIGNAPDYLCHHGILGQKWGVRRFQNEDGSLTESGKKRAMKQDMKWIKKNEDKIHKQAYKESKKEIQEYANLLGQAYSLNKNGKVSKSYINALNQGMAALMNDKVKDLKSPSGRVVQFVAKRGEQGVYTALADAGYDMSQVKNGVWSSGRIAYKQKGVQVAN